MAIVQIGCAGWNIPKAYDAFFKPGGSHLTRYASSFDSVEINSSFSRTHRSKTYARWAESVFAEFMFAVKVPKVITHDRKLVDTGDVLNSFLDEVTNLGAKCGPLLFQLPPSLQFDCDIAKRFFDLLRSLSSISAVCEPRHPSWFTSTANHLLEQFEIGRVAADPSIVAAAAEPGGWRKLVYYRLHGSPNIYYSKYAKEFLDQLIDKLVAHDDSESVWCIFDNTAEGFATEDALYVLKELGRRRCRTSQ